MRLFSKIFSIILVLSVLYVLFVPSVKANCYYDRYDNCVGTCSCPSGTSGTCTCSEASGICSADTSNCKAPTNTPAQQPTSTPKPTNPPPTSGASPTVTPAGGCKCQNGKCVGDLTKCTYTVSGCPQTCSDPTKNADIEEYCTTTNQTCSIKPCAGYSASCVTDSASFFL